MADLLASQDVKSLHVSRGQELTGEVISVLPQEIILEVGKKSEAVLYKRDLSQTQIDSLKPGTKIQVYVLQPENESGQIIVTFTRTSGKPLPNISKWNKLSDALNTNHTLKAKVLEVNKGGLLAEVNGIRGFIPASRVGLDSIKNLESLVAQEINVKVVEIDPNQNRLILAQKIDAQDEVVNKLSKVKPGDKVNGKIAAILPFGVFVSLTGENVDGLTGFIHISEMSWERVEDPSKFFALDQDVEAVIISVDAENARVNLSAKELQEDPFEKLAENFQPDDVVKGTVSRLVENGVYFTLAEGVEGFMPNEVLEPGTVFEVGQSKNVLIDKVDKARRRILLAPFRTSTEGLIYK